ncbi:MAG: hypothetical protein GY750_09750 [Lentisphaerae bacterium]|nr:hypothetical protein [Lentisphaerota bacterium]MCP4101694.1 hypothetical protein [Lentisphaerota bacterium]
MRFFQKLLSDLRRGYYAKAIIKFFTAIYRMLLYIIWHPVRGTIFAVSMYLLIRYLWKRRNLRHKDLILNNKLPKTTFELSRMYQKIVKKLSRREDFCIKVSTTPAEIIVQLPKSSLEKETISYMQQVLEEYQKMRFREKPPEHDKVKEFKRFVRKKK